jgi:hypothetical protein
MTWQFSIRDCFWALAVAAFAVMNIRHEREIGQLQHTDEAHFTHHVTAWIQLFDRVDSLTSGNPDRDQDIAILQGQVDSLQAQINQLKKESP